MLAIGAFCAETQEEAELLAGTAVYRKMARQMLGEAEDLLSPEAVQDKRKAFPDKSRKVYINYWKLTYNSLLNNLRLYFF